MNTPRASLKRLQATSASGAPDCATLDGAMSPSVTALAVVSGVVLLACSMVVRTLLARRAIRNWLREASGNPERHPPSAAEVARMERSHSLDLMPKAAE